jgi:hypothetical protein
MDWAFWVGSTIFVGTVGGMLWMRNRPLRDVHGHHVDADGRRLPSPDRLTRAVLTELLDADHAPRSAYELRRRLRLPMDRFYELTGRMVLHGLITWRPPHDVLDNTNVAVYGRYELTETGIARALGLDRAVARGRHRVQ